MVRLRSWVGRLVWPALGELGDAETVVCHEWLTVIGGSDKVATELASLVDADVLCTFALDDACVAALGLDVPVVTWRWGRWAGRSRRFTYLLPIMPVVWWALDLPRVRSIVTSSHSCVNAVRAPGAHRLSYCHTPMRYAWAWRLERERLQQPLRALLPVVAAVFRRLDRRWSQRVDRYVANSSYVAERIRHAYGVEATVVHPPIDVAPRRTVEPSAVGDEAPFVTAGRWVAYKRFDLAIDAANRAGVALVVAGAGPERDRLRALAGPTVEFVDEPGDDELDELLRGARAFLFCGIEDFGMLAVEAQACGTPVIARNEGGARDSVVDGTTGVLVGSDDPAEWAAALASFDHRSFDRAVVGRHAETFDTERFREGVRAVLAER